MKPNIPRLTLHHGIWLCTSADTFGLGHTFHKAYESWYQKRIMRGVRM
jgi:hypothetical protein